MGNAPKRRKTSFTLDPLVYDQFVVAVAHRHKRTHGGILSEVVEGLMNKWTAEVMGDAFVDPLGASEQE